MTSRSENVGFAVILALSVVLRLGNLDEQPLTAAEAARSWAALSAVSGQTTDPGALSPRPDSAVLFASQHALFWMIGAGDAAARLMPAVAGALIVLVPWAVRASLGSAEALILAVLFAFDPIAVAYARSADGTAIGVAAIWTALLCGKAGADRPMWTAAAVAMLSGPVFWDLVLPALLIARVVLRVRARLNWVFVGIVALVVATSGLSQWWGPQLVSVAATIWLEGWVTPTGVSMPEVYSTVARLEAPALAFGLAAFVVGFRRQWRAAAALALCVAWAVLLSTRPGRTLSAWFALQLPLFFAIVLVAPQVQPIVARWRKRPLVAAPAAALAGLLALHLVASPFVIAEAGDSLPSTAPVSVTPHAARQAGDVVRGMQRVSIVEVASPRGVDPLLAWYLRDPHDVRWVAAPSLRVRPDVMQVAIQEGQQPTLVIR